MPTWIIRRKISVRHEEFDRTGIERRDEFQKRAWIGMCGSGNVLRADSNFEFREEKEMPTRT